MWKSKWITSMLLVFFMVSVFAGAGSAPVRASTIPDDIIGSWAFMETNFLLEQGIAYGYPDGSFKPDNLVTRAEFIAMINRAFGYTVMTPIFYSDVKPFDWFYPDVAKGTAAGYIAGFIDGTVRPNAPVSRQEAAAIVARVMKLKTTEAGTLSFTDASAIPGWSYNSIAAMVKAGLLSGYQDGTLRPFNPIVRAEAATILYHAIKIQVPVSGITLNKASITMTAGETVNLEATIVPDNAFIKDVIWTSTDQNVAMVSSTGQVTAKGEGTCAVMATSVDGAFYDSCKITVAEEGRINSISLNQDEVVIMEGGSFRLIPKISPAGIDYPKLRWYSDDEDVAKVNEGGLIMARGEDGDECEITVYSAEDKKIYAECQVEIDGYDSDLREDVKAIILNEDNLEIEQDAYFQLWATIDPADAFNQRINWRTSNANVATVDYNGLIRARRAGTCTIKAYWDEDNSVKAECEVEVVVPEEATYAALDDTSIELEPGESDIIRGTLKNTQAHIADITWVIASGDNVVDVDIDKYDDYFRATIKAKEDAEEGSECRINFTVLDKDGNEYEVACKVTIVS